ARRGGGRAAGGRVELDDVQPRARRRPRGRGRRDRRPRPPVGVRDQLGLVPAPRRRAPARAPARGGAGGAGVPAREPAAAAGRPEARARAARGDDGRLRLRPGEHGIARVRARLRVLRHVGGCDRRLLRRGRRGDGAPRRGPRRRLPPPAGVHPGSARRRNPPLLDRAVAPARARLPRRRGVRLPRLEHRRDDTARAGRRTIAARADHGALVDRVPRAPAGGEPDGRSARRCVRRPRGRRGARRAGARWGRRCAAYAAPMAAPLRRALTHARRFPEPFWALVGGSAVQSLGSGVLVPYWGLYLTSELHASGAAAGALLAAAGAMGLVGAPLGGYLTDRLGRRPTLVLGLGGTALWFALYGAIHSVPWLFALTILFPPTGDVWPAATSAATADLLAPGLRAEGYGLQRQAQMAAFALGPPLGALLVTALSLRWVFWAPALGNGIGIMVYVQFDSVLGVFLHRERGYSLAAWGLVFGISPVLVATTQLFVARWAGRRSPRAMLAFGVVLEGAALCALWPTSVLPVLVVAVVAVTAGEMIVQPIASTVAAA